MEKRVVFCGLFNFPRGGASSNYVQYLGASFVEAGYEVHIITNINSEYQCEEKPYCGMYLHRVEIPRNKWLKKVFYRFTIGHCYLQELRKMKMTSDDRVIMYSHHMLLMKTVVKYMRKRCVPVGACLVEHYASNDFLKKEKDKQFIEECGIFQLIYEKCDFAFPISRYIENKLEGGKPLVFRIPVLTDVFEFPYRKDGGDSIRRFIYPANGRIKDGLEEMLQAIKIILMKYEKPCEFHFCGVREEKLKQELGVELFECEYGNRLFVHGWIKYNELINLYQSMTFLLLAREKKQMTIANFPSKVPELLTYGVIPIASDVGDYTKYYLKDDITGILMDGCSDVIIADAIIKALQMSNAEIENMSQKARKLAEDVFDYRVWSERLKRFLINISCND